jgi:hypothetical protein
VPCVADTLAIDARGTGPIANGLNGESLLSQRVLAGCCGGSQKHKGFSAMFRAAGATQKNSSLNSLPSRMTRFAAMIEKEGLRIRHYITFDANADEVIVSQEDFLALFDNRAYVEERDPDYITRNYVTLAQPVRGAIGGWVFKSRLFS